MNSILVVVANLLVIGALLWLFDVLYRAYRLDLLRFHIFRARDDLFLAAERGEIAFEDRAYGMTRQMLNGMIRYAHVLGLWRAVALILFQRRTADIKELERFWASYGEAIKALPLHSRKQVMRAMAEAHVAILSYLCHTSLLLFPFVFVGKWMIRLASRVSGFARIARKAIPAQAKQIFDHQAYEIGA
ncbi:hypothetical protein [Steroidobacter sp.]|uniref:hypothetical protein n=1 Tax=Steroidobacter sp. TaxID=1978227 RepID=UPI001A3A91CB|nr:hypothetical protein [Steroidobacter sp.]MBL8271209.1 hypothetical protein [Steroidobacter sp.]